MDRALILLCRLIVRLCNAITRSGDAKVECNRATSLLAAVQQSKSGSEEISAGLLQLKVLKFTFVLALLVSHRLKFIKITPDHKSDA
jgi:hypothetical protein